MIAEWAVIELSGGDGRTAVPCPSPPGICYIVEGDSDELLLAFWSAPQEDS